MAFKDDISKNAFHASGKKINEKKNRSFVFNVGQHWEHALHVTRSMRISERM